MELKHIEDLMVAGYEGERDSLRHAVGFGRSVVYLQLILRELPQDRQEYWADRMEHLAAQRRQEKIDSKQIQQ